MPRGIPLSEAAREQARERISQAAIRLFLRQGYGRTSMREIAEGAGMGKSSLYRYVASKDDILLLSVDREMARLQTAEGEAVEEGLHALKNLRRLVKGRG